jgi:hypothetical protein
MFLGYEQLCKAFVEDDKVLWYWLTGLNNSESNSFESSKGLIHK